MQHRSSFDRELLIPVVIGVVSILGIVWILLTTNLGKSLIPPTALPSSFNSRDVGTLTPSPSLTPTPEKTLSAATVTVPVAYPGPADELPSTSTMITESLPSPSATYTPDRMQPFPVGKYDDTDPNIAYDQYWTGLKNPGTANAYKGTIHISRGNGNEASFRFTGEQFRLGYQRGNNFGIVTVIIDDQSYSFSEQAFDLVWRSPQLSPGDHFVRLIHDSGESVNLDYIEILD